MRRLLFPMWMIAVAACTAMGQQGKLPDEGGLDVSERKEAKAAVERALHWFETQQDETGAWQPAVIPGVTGLVVMGFLGHDGKGFGESNEHVHKGIDYILTQVKEDGSITGEMYVDYNTAICMMALMATKDPKYKDIIENGRRFLLRRQCDEEDGYQPNSAMYGGIGCAPDGQPCLSNTELALEAIKHSEEGLPDADKPPNRLHWEKAIRFLQRCQNLRKTNDQPWAADDGGFIYAPGTSKVGGTTSYGNTTYTGIKSLIYAGVDRDDPRVQAAVSWIKNNYTLDGNPGMGEQGLYYAYYTFAKAMDAYGREVLTDAQGKRHAWRKELVSKLLSLQRGDGSWMNINGRWLESNPVLVTAYAVISLEIAYSRP